MPPHYARLGRYIAQLPEGLASFPECEAKASVHRRVVDYSGLALTGLPPELQRLIDEPPTHSTWIPQCQSLALLLATLDAVNLDQEAEVKWIRKASTHVFSSPMYRILMWAATPRTLFKGAHMRWSAFFRGSNLEAEVGDGQAYITLCSPEALFTRDLAGVFENVLAAATNFTEEGDGSLALDEYVPGAIRYRGAWR